MAKLIALTLLAVFVTIFVAVSANDGKDSKMSKMFDDSADACQDKMSNETMGALQANNEYDNEEVREFQACMYKDMGFMKNGKFDVGSMNKTIDQNVDDKDKAEMMKGTFDSCAKSANDAGSESEVASKFTKCAMKMKKNNKN